MIVAVTGLALVVAAVFSRKLGLGVAEDFVAYRYLGISRRTTAIVGAILSLTAIACMAWFRDGTSTRGGLRHIVSEAMNHLYRNGVRYYANASSAIAKAPRIVLGETRLQLSGAVRDMPRTYHFVAIAVQLGSLYAFSSSFFHANSAFLFHGLDGAYVMSIANQQHVWSNTLLGLTNNFFQSLGNVSFPLNTSLVPSYVLSLHLNGGSLDPVVSYVFFAMELFAALYVFCYVTTRSPVIASSAAWGFVVLVMPLTGYAAVYGIYGLIPHMATLTALTLLSMLLFGEVGRGGMIRTLSCALGMVVVLFWLVMVKPMFLVIIVPTLTLLGSCLIVSAANPRERSTKLAAALVVMLLFLATGVFHFLFGLFKNTAAHFFAAELFNDRQSLSFASIAFHKQSFGLGGPAMFWLAVAGGLVAAIASKGLVRTLAIGMLSLICILIGTGFVMTKFDFWTGPSPLYFEFFLWPIYAMYAAIIPGIAVAFAVRAFVKWRASYAKPNRRANGALVELAVCGVFAAVPWLIFDGYQKLGSNKVRDFPFPPAETSIVAYLRGKVGLNPGSEFRGRVATFTGLGVAKPVTWLDLHAVDLGLVKEYANEHRMVGLWHFNVPTLFEYNQFISPAFYSMTRHALANADDLPMRTVVTLRRVEPRLLRLLGVRYLITDRPISMDANLLMRLPDKSDARLYLYELKDVNLGNFSPTKFRLYTGARDYIAALADANFDAEHEVLADEPLPVSLVKASSSKLTVEKGHLRISAESAGLSIVVLPVEYSHCIEIEHTGSPATAPRLFRANLIQTGVVFTRSLDASLTYFTGPFRNSRCRIDDARDMERLDIRLTSLGRRAH